MAVLSGPRGCRTGASRNVSFYCRMRARLECARRGTTIRAFETLCVVEKKRETPLPGGPLMRTRLIDHAVELVLVGAVLLVGLVVVQTGLFGSAISGLSRLHATVTEAAFAEEDLVVDAPPEHHYVRLVAEPTRLVPTFGDWGGEATADDGADEPDEDVDS